MGESDFGDTQQKPELSSEVLSTHCSKRRKHTTGTQCPTSLPISSVDTECPRACTQVHPSTHCLTHTQSNMWPTCDLNDCSAVSPLPMVWAVTKGAQCYPEHQEWVIANSMPVGVERGQRTLHIWHLGTTRSRARNDCFCCSSIQPVLPLPYKTMTICFGGTQIWTLLLNEPRVRSPGFQPQLCY